MNEQQAKAKFLRYILKPYQIRRTMCRVYLAFFILKAVYKHRKELYLEYRLYIIELQDKYRVWKLHLAEMMQGITDIQLYATDMLRMIHEIENE